MLQAFYNVDGTVIDERKPKNGIKLLDASFVCGFRSHLKQFPMPRSNFVIMPYQLIKNACEINLCLLSAECSVHPQEISALQLERRNVICTLLDLLCNDNTMISTNLLSYVRSMPSMMRVLNYNTTFLINSTLLIWPKFLSCSKIVEELKAFSWCKESMPFVCKRLLQLLLELFNINPYITSEQKVKTLAKIKSLSGSDVTKIFVSLVVMKLQYFQSIVHDKFLTELILLLIKPALTSSFTAVQRSNELLKVGDKTKTVLTVSNHWEIAERIKPLIRCIASKTFSHTESATSLTLVRQIVFREVQKLVGQRLSSDQRTLCERIANVIDENMKLVIGSYKNE